LEQTDKTVPELSRSNSADADRRSGEVANRGGGGRRARAPRWCGKPRRREQSESRSAATRPRAHALENLSPCPSPARRGFRGDRPRTAAELAEQPRQVCASC